MPYCFELESGLTDNVRRIALQQLNKAAKHLSTEAEQSSAILEARKALKRLRALLKLIRPALDVSVYKVEAARFRESGRLLSTARDAQILEDTLSKLQSDRPDDVPPRVFEELRAILPDLTEGPLAVSRSILAEARHDIEYARRTYRHFELERTDPKVLFMGLERSYRKARKAYQDAYRYNTAEAFHEWRKPMQVHWRHTQLLQNAWPAWFSARIDAARALSHVLGDDQDLSVLLSFADRATQQGWLKAQDHNQLQHIVIQKQKHLRGIARHMGALLFGEPAKAHATRASEMWTAARALQEAKHGSALLARPKPEKR